MTHDSFLASVAARIAEEANSVLRRGSSPAKAYKSLTPTRFRKICEHARERLLTIGIYERLNIEAVRNGQLPFPILSGRYCPKGLLTAIWALADRVGGGLPNAPLHEFNSDGAVGLLGRLIRWCDELRDHAGQSMTFETWAKTSTRRALEMRAQESGVIAELGETGTAASPSEELQDGIINSFLRSAFGETSASPPRRDGRGNAGSPPAATAIPTAASGISEISSEKEDGSGVSHLIALGNSLKGEQSDSIKNSPTAPPTVDLRDYIPAKDCRGAGIDTHDKLKGAIQKHGLRYIRKGQRLFIHAGDWLRLIRQIESRVEAVLDSAEAAEVLDQIVARNEEIRQKKAKKDQSQ